MEESLILPTGRKMIQASADDIADTALKISECEREQRDQIEELEELDRTIISFQRTNSKYREAVNRVRGRMRRLETELK